MATLLLQGAGAAVGSLFGPIGAVVGRAVGGLAGSLADAALFSTRTTTEGPRLASLEVQTGEEGRAVPRVYGRARVAGTMIWATRYEEEVVEEETGGKGGSTIRTYRYYANFAVGLCEGRIDRIGRVWADGKPLDLATVAVRFHLGGEGQVEDPLIAARQGATPAYRGLAYAVFERLPLDGFGNRIPQLAFEVVRVVDRLEGLTRAVTMIPGATEFGYATTRVTRTVGTGWTVQDNRHVGTAETDFAASLDELCALCPNLERVSLVVAWFGDDLRADRCALRPKVEGSGRDTEGLGWSVSGIGRSAALTVSAVDGHPAFGGTPSDNAVVEAIRAIRERGLEVVFYPFVLMDVPAGNGLGDPYGDGEQAAYPWRGRITVAPAPGRPGSPDGSAAAAAAVAAFVGSAAAGDFTPSGNSVDYHGPAEWSFRRMILHYAHLAEVAGGVDAFLIGSELRGLTRLRGPGRSHPFVAALVELAHAVRGVLRPATRISYAADWSEYFGHQPDDGSGDVAFHLDPLWSDAAIDFIGIDVYWPLADWRDGEHADSAAVSIYDAAYLGGNVAGGEGFDWYYASAEDRETGTRTPITDGAYGKPWVFRYKDLVSWWSSPHRDRIGGVEAEADTAWEPRSKPIWFTELGCPAVDRGANQPNVFVDPKSSESALPYFSNGARDDAVQRRFLEAVLDHFTPGSPTFAAANNPLAPGGFRMVEPGAIHLWTWDARPWPAFPALGEVWADGVNWRLGHWLNGRFGGTSLAALVSAILADHSFHDFSVEGMHTTVDGYVVDRPMAARDAIAPLASAFQFDGFDRGDRVHFADFDRPPVATLDAAELVEEAEAGAVLSRTRTQDLELPQAVRLAHLDSGRDFAAAVAASRRLPGQGGDSVDVELAVIAAGETMRMAAERTLQHRWAARQRVEWTAPPSRTALQPGDPVRLVTAIGTLDLVLTEVEDGGRLRTVALGLDRSVFRGTAATPPAMVTAAPAIFGPPAAVFLDVPPADSSLPAHRPFLAATATPWPGSVVVEQSPSGGSYTMLARIERRAAIGVLAEALGPGPEDRWDHGNRLLLDIPRALESRDDVDVLAGANLLAVAAGAEGEEGWELVQFATAALVGSGRYALTRLLRARHGTEEAMAAGHPAGATVVALDAAVVQLPLARDAVGRTLNLRATAGGDPATASVTLTVTPAGRGLRPLSPVHLRAVRGGDGAVRLTWIRRTRVAGDDWSAEEVPLGEESERYRVAILDGTTVRRSFTVTAPEALYTLAMQVEDFGSAPATLAVRVAQIGAGYGAGSYRRAVFDV